MTLDEYLRLLELKRLVLACSRYDARVCPAQALHRREFDYRNGKWICRACIRLGEWIAV
jgi:hypothetical protein